MLLHDYIVTLGLDGFKGIIGEKNDARQMEEAIRVYVEKQWNVNFNCTREEEIDFGGVIEYLCGNFHDDIEQRLTGENSEIRGRAHRHIVAEAVTYAKANTIIQEKRVKKMVNDALSILCAFFEKRLSREQKYLAARIADDVTQNVALQHEDQNEILLRAIKENANQVPLAHDRARQLAQDEKLDTMR